MNHLKQVCEGYLEHMSHALHYSSWLAYAAFAAFVHAFLPFFYERTASSIINNLNSEIVGRLRSVK